jgi:hypothetical protein
MPSLEYRRSLLTPHNISSLTPSPFLPNTYHLPSSLTPTIFPPPPGTALGERVRDFCKKWGFALVWGMGKNGQKDIPHGGTHNLILNRRVLDANSLGTRLVEWA